MTGKIQRAQKGNPVSFRLSVEALKKVDEITRETGKTKTAIIDEFIINGIVKPIYNSKELVKEVAGVHNLINQYGLSLSKDIQEIKTTIHLLENKVNEVDSESPKVQPFLIRADILLDQMEMKYKIKEAEWEYLLVERRQQNGCF